MCLFGFIQGMGAVLIPCFLAFEQNITTMALAQPKSGKKKEKGFLSSISIYDQAKNKAVEASYVSSIATDARENIARLAEESNGDPKVFNEISTKYLKGLRGGISEDFQDIVQLAIDPVVAAGRAQIQSEYSARQDQEVNDALILEAQSALDFSIPRLSACAAEYLFL